MKQKIQYSQCWEDADLLIKALQPNANDRILSITSGGDNTLRLAMENPEAIVAIDKSYAQNYLLELKWKAIKNWDHEKVLAFMGITYSNSRKQDYEELKHELSEEAQGFWEKNLNNLNKGIIHCGKFENYLQAFRKYFIPFIHNKKKIHTLLKEKTKEEQMEFYQKSWENRRWKLLFRIFFCKAVMKKRGRGKGMFEYTQIDNVSDHYLAKARQALSCETLFHNSYMEYIFLGNSSNNLPSYLNKEVAAKLKNKSINMVTADLLDYLKVTPDNYFTKYNLSDVFEPMTQEKTNLIFQEILRTGEHGAQLIFWNNLVKRGIPKELKNHFRKEVSLEEEVKKTDKVFFYDSFHIYTLIK